MTQAEQELELLSQYDEDTGSPKMETLARANEDAIADLIARAEALTKLKASSGWKVVEEFINDQLSAHTKKLITETDFKEVRRLQEYLKALSIVPAWIDSTISEASQFVESVSQQAQDPE